MCSSDMAVPVAPWPSSLLQEARLPLDGMVVTRWLACDMHVYLSASKQMSCVPLQAELQQQLADCTSTSWEGFHIIQLKIQALVSWLCA